MSPPTDPVAALAKLDGEKANATAARNEAARRVAELESARRKLEDDRRLAYAEVARDPDAAQDRAAKIEKRVTQNGEELAHARAVLAGAAIATRQVVEEANRLLKDERAAFYEAAEEVTQAALAEVAALEESYRQAWRAWQLAADAWDRPARVNKLGGVAACPLPYPEDVFGTLRAGIAPRPLRVEISEAEEAA